VINRQIISLMLLPNYRKGDRSSGDWAHDLLRLLYRLRHRSGMSLL